MNNSYRAVVIGGGVVGCSVLYHLAKLGWTDVALIERSKLTAGSTWHAAGGFHPLNNDMSISSLQAYTISLYDEIEKESGQDIGLVKTGNVALAANPERWEYLKYTRTIFQTMDIELDLMTPQQIQEACPLVEVSDLYGGLWDPLVGHVDPHGTTVAYAKAAQHRGATIMLDNRVLALNRRAEGAWDVVTEMGTVIAEHVVNAGGLWARKVGAMAGVSLPVTPMQHHYLVTEDIPELQQRSAPVAAIVDLDGFTYMRQERQGILLGIYELNPKVWNLEGASWDYGMDLIPEEIDRIAAQLEKGFERFPILAQVGVKRWVNGAFTFTPDGNPLVGPVPGLRNYWVACGVMAGFSQGGGVGLALAQWMIEGEPEADVFAMDVARYGEFAAESKFLAATARQFYARRFVMTYPNEELPAGRPLHVSPIHDDLSASGAQFGFLWGLEVPLLFTPEDDAFAEAPTLRRSNAFDCIGQEVSAVRSAAGIVDITGFSRYEISGPQSAQWLDLMLASKLPPVGGVRLAPMLMPSGRLAGDLTVLRLQDDRFWLMGSYYLQAWHLRWLNEHKPRRGVEISNLCGQWAGVSICGPASREIFKNWIQSDTADIAFGFLHVREFEVGDIQAVVVRLSVTGELGYEINVPAGSLPSVYRSASACGHRFGLRPFGFRAMNSLRMEKGFGVWSKEFTSAYTPKMCGLDRFIDSEKGRFIGRDAFLAAHDRLPSQVLALLDIDSPDADVSGFEPVWLKGRRVGFVTSGGYGHWVGKSLAFAYMDRSCIDEEQDFSVDVVGARRTARILSDAPYDAAGAKMRS